MSSLYATAGGVASGILPIVLDLFARGRHNPTMPLHEHPAATLFPLMSVADLRALADDIKTNGLQKPITTVEENGDRFILDGRNRFRACAMAGVEPAFNVLTVGDPIAFVISANLQRRHMSTTQRAEVADKLATMRREDNLKKGARKPETQRCVSVAASLSEAGKLLGVSPRSITSFRKVKKHGAPELVEAMTSEKIGMEGAAKIAGLPKPEQRRAMDAVADGAPLRTLRALAPPERAPDLEAEEPAPQKAGPVHRKHDRDVVRRLLDQGFTVSDIVEQTGLKKNFVNHVRREIAAPKSIMSGAIQDAEVFAESWASRCERMDPRWLAAPKNEKDALVKALSACRAASLRAIRRLNKEAIGETDEIREAEAV